MKKIKFNKMFFKKSIATSLLVLSASNFVACSNKTTIDFNIDETVLSSDIVTNKVNEINEVRESKKESPKESITTESLLEKISDTEVPNYIDTTTYSLENSDKLVPDNKITKEELYLAAYALDKCKNLDRDKLFKELNNIMVEQINPTDMDEVTWNENFESLISTLDEKESLQDTYYVLAYLIHLTSCTEKHSYDEVNTLSCKVLEKEYNNRYEKEN